jgi:membrane protein implicated in regulation of membrane protease activity
VTNKFIWIISGVAAVVIATLGLIRFGITWQSVTLAILGVLVILLRPIMLRLVRKSAKDARDGSQ